MNAKSHAVVFWSPMKATEPNSVPSMSRTRWPIEATRSAFGLNRRATERVFSASTREAVDANQHATLLENIRLWDWRAYSDTITQIQALRPYYTFPDTDVDRYQINGRIKQVNAINPYDYDGGRGIRRSSGVANLVSSLSNVPVIGGVVMRFRQYGVFKKIMEGGVVHKDALPPALVREMNEVGNRPHHYRAQMSLVRHWAGWEDARADYAKITVPVLLIYGEHDWSRPGEREANRRAIPRATMTILKDGGHFLSLDAPEAVIQLILRFNRAM